VESEFFFYRDAESVASAILSPESWKEAVQDRCIMTEINAAVRDKLRAGSRKLDWLSKNLLVFSLHLRRSVRSFSAGAHLDPTALHLPSAGPRPMVRFLGCAHGAAGLAALAVAASTQARLLDVSTRWCVFQQCAEQ
jgi:hypothetical protein